MSTDPLLQPFRLKHLALRNRLMSTAHEPAYTEDGMPKERYRLYHAREGEGRIALTMIGGSSMVAPDSPQAFGNILLYKDEVVRWLKELADDVHAHGAAVMIQITHLGRRTSWSKADWLPVLAPSNVREPAHRAFPKATEDWDIARIDRGLRRRRRTLQGGRPRRARIRMLRPSARPVLVARHQQARRRLWRLAREPHALLLEVLDAVRERVGQDFIVGVRMVCDEDLGSRPFARGRRLDRATPRRDRHHRLHQCHPRPYRHRRGALACHPRHGRALGAASRLRRRGEGRDADARLSMRRASRTSRRRATPSRAASSTWSA